MFTPVRSLNPSFSAIRIIEEDVHAMLLTTPKTAMKSSSTRERSGTDSFYFPGCRKTTDCNCDMCVASINATRDLVSSRSSNLQKQVSITKTSQTKKMLPVVTTASPALHSTAKSMPIEKKEREEKERRKGLGFRSGGSLVMWKVVIFAILMIDFVVPAMMVRVSGGPKMSAEVVRKVGEELDVKANFRGRLRFLEERLGHVSGEKINNCSSVDKNWLLDKDGPLLHIRCILYKNMVEEVSIWGFPVQTSGLLTTGLSPKSFTVISGKINEWSGNKLRFDGRRRSESWISSKRNAMAVQLTGNTWILEYNQSPLLEDSRLIPLMKEFLTSRASHVMNEILQLDWLLQTSSYRSYVVKSSNYEAGRSSLPPT